MKESNIHFFKYRSGLIFFIALFIVSVIISYFVSVFTAHANEVYFFGYSISVSALLTWVIVKLEKKCTGYPLKLFLGLLITAFVLSFIIIYL